MDTTKVIKGLKADIKTKDKVIQAKDTENAALLAENAALLAENAALRAQVHEAWRGHLSRSVAGALAESAAHRRSLATGRCAP